MQELMIFVGRNNWVGIEGTEREWATSKDYRREGGREVDEEEEQEERKIRYLYIWAKKM